MPTITSKARRKTTWSQKKQKTKSVVGGDPNAPDGAEWKTMTAYGNFQVQDDDGDLHLFSVGQVAQILPHGVDPGEDIWPWQYWVGKIKDIRVRNAEDVWAKVQWFYSGSDARGVVKSFQGNACRQYERLASDHYDLVSTDCFECITEMHAYDESSVDQDDIPNGEFFYRHEIEHTIPRITALGNKQSCICRNLYDPLDNSTIMHFCPRPSCTTWYHDKCLSRQNHVPLDSSHSDAKWKLALLDCSPDTNDPEYSALPSSHRRDSSSPSPRPSSDELDAPLRALPPDLLAIAQCPIVKGAKLAMDTITGNVRQVVAARRIVYDAVKHGGIIDGWEDKVDIEIARSAMRGLGINLSPNGAKKKTKAILKGEVMARFVCPKCESAI